VKERRENGVNARLSEERLFLVIVRDHRDAFASGLRCEGVADEGHEFSEQRFLFKETV
jgi:hypothetical protein